jgi:hypothetical protein
MQNGGMTLRRRGACMLLVGLTVMVTACSDKTPRAVGPPSPTPITPDTPTPAASTASPPAGAIAVPKGWPTFSYQKISFAYPPVPGTFEASSATDGGVRRAWFIKRSDLCDPRGTCRTYEIAAVNDGCPATGGWPTFAHRWIQSGDTHSVTTCAGEDSFKIKPLRIVTRPDGLRGVIFRAKELYPAGQTVGGSLAAVLNFPKKFDKHYEAIAFYFEGPTPLDRVETVLRVVALKT